MKIKILGSAAAEALPALFCECQLCRNARLHKGKDLRRRCSYLLDNDTLIDFGPDAFYQSNDFNIDLTLIERIIFTHAHEDHLAPIELLWRHAGYSAVTKNIDIIGDKAVRERIENESHSNYAELHLNDIQIAPNEKVISENTEIFAVRANHAPSSTPLNYVITRGGKTLLIANDTGMWSEESWSQLAAYGRKFDIAVIEATMGLKNPDCDSGHLGVNKTVEVRDRLRGMGLI